jgi:predicted metal-dependent hydrolase
MHQIAVAGLVIDVVRKDIKNLHLGVYPPDGRVRIATPLTVDDDNVRIYAISKLGWIRKQQCKYAEQERQSEREYVSGETHYFQGRRYRLNVVCDSGKPGVFVRNNAFIDLSVPCGSDRYERERVYTHWCRRQLKEQAPALIDKWQEAACVEAAAWGVRRMRTKWGTCNIEDRRIWLNLELVKKPVGCLEYVIVHELVHLLERHHNDRFLKHMDRLLPHWRFLKDELNRYPLLEIGPVNVDDAL